MAKTDTPSEKPDDKILRDYPRLERVRELLALDRATGNLIWLETRGRRRFGAIAGSQRRDGYVAVDICGQKLGVHRVVWAMVAGEWQPDGMLVDHINGDTRDNRPENLRLASPTQNQANRKKQRGKSAPKGVRLHPCGKWEARIRDRGKPTYLGLFSTAEDAKLAYDQAQRGMMGEFARP